MVTTTKELKSILHGSVTYSKPLTKTGTTTSPTIGEALKTALRLDLMEHGTIPDAMLSVIMFVRSKTLNIQRD